MILGKCLAYFKKLRKLDLSTCLLGDKGSLPVLKGLSGLSLTSLDLSRNNLGDEAITYLSTQVNHLKVRDLKLMGNAIGNSGLSHLGGFVKDHPALKVLFLSDNTIGYLRRNCTFGDEGILSFAAGLKQSNVEALYLDGNNIGLTGVQALMKALPPSLRVINLNYNQGCQDVAYLFDNDTDNLKHVEELFLRGWELNNKTAQKIATLIASGQLKTLDLQGPNRSYDLTPMAESVQAILLQAAASPLAHSHLQILGVKKKIMFDLPCFYHGTIYSAPKKSALDSAISTKKNNKIFLGFFKGRTKRDSLLKDKSKAHGCAMF